MNEEEKFLVYKFGEMAFSEPMTSLTNLFIFIQCVFLTMNVYKKVKSTKVFINVLLGGFFLFMGLSALFGGISHGLRFHLSASEWRIMWLIMSLCSGISILFIEMATLNLKLFSSQKINYFSILFFVKFLIFGFYVINYPDFIISKINVVLGLLFVLIGGFISWRRGSQIARFIFYGILFSLSTGIIHSLKISISDQFNYKAISHILIMISLQIIYNGIREQQSNDQ